jgi:hypothetical protein
VPLRRCPAPAQGPYTLVALAHRDVPEDQAWLGLLEHQADVVVELQQLEGRTADIDGQLDITWRRAAAGRQQVGRRLLGQQHAGSGSSRYFFRAGEASIRWVQSVGANDIL